MDIEDAKDGIAAAIKERMGSPILSSIVLSWPFINYRLLIVCFGQGSYAEKLAYIDNHLYCSEIGRWMHIAILPLLVGLFYTLIYPRLDTCFTDIYVRLIHEKKRREILADQRKPFDAVFQAEFFADWNKKNDELKKTMENQNRRNAEINKDYLKKNSDFRVRLRSQVLLRVAVECGGIRKDLEDIGSTISAVKDNPEVTKKIKMLLEKHPQWKSLKGFMSWVAASFPPGGMELGQIITADMDQIKYATGLEEGDILDFMEMLVFLGIIASPEKFDLWWPVTIGYDEYLNITFINDL
jgi:hypothetical protein